MSETTPTETFDTGNQAASEGAAKPAGRREPTEIDAIAEEHVQRLLELRPEMSIVLGVPGHEADYGDYSPAGLEAYAQQVKDTLARLDGVAARDRVDEVTLDAMRERLGLEVEIHDAGYDLAELNNIASPAQSIRAVFDLMPRENQQDWQHIAERLHHVPAAIEGYIAALKEGAARGLVSAKRQVKNVIEQAERLNAEDGFFATLAQQGNALAEPLPPALSEQLTQGAQLAGAAYRNLSAFLSDELLPLAPEKDAVGRTRYALASRDFLGSTIDLEETYTWGVAELERIIAEQEKIADQIKAGASIAEAKDILNADPARQLHGTEALREWMQKRSDEAVESLSATHFDIEGPMRRLECRIAPTHEGGIYYTGPSDDFSRPGQMWWSVPEGEDTFSTWQELTTVYHEGVPGHHLQVATAVAGKDELNSWRRNISWVSGHGEGWALYAERLMDELGYLEDLGDKMGMLDAQRMRAARVVFDIGVHLELPVPARWGTGTWDAAKGYTFLKENFGMGGGQLDFEFNRYLGWPGQAPSYKVGQRLWEEIRDEARRAAGDDFDPRAFHTQALSIGSVGLDTLRRALAPQETPAPQATEQPS